MAILRAFIDDLLARTDIVDLIDARVPLKKAGKNYSACCPFHNEKTPSFSVAPDKQFYHCFGCGVHGNAISFLMEFDRLEFPEAIEELARMHGLEVQHDDQTSQRPARPQAKDQYELMEHVSKYYRQSLQQHSEGARAIEYLKGRGLSGETAQKFGIGYAGSEWDNVLQTFGQTPKLKQDLVQLGMVIQKENGKQYDRFRERIMFPIRDRRGRVIGFGGRILDRGEPKYLNSPETPIFHKGNELYGLYEVKQAHRQIQRIIVVEGYMDVVALAQYGVDYAVASLGTATTSEQLQLLFRQTHHVTCCYDGDNAGRGAAKRALENALPLLRDGKTLDFVFLPDGEDPDTLVQAQGKAAFESLLEQATPLSQVLFDNLLAEHNAVTDAGKSALVAAAKPMLEKVPEGEYQNQLFDRLNELVGLNKGMSARRIQSSAQRSVHSRWAARHSGVDMTPMRKAIAIVLQYPEFGNRLPELPELSQLATPGVDLLLALLRMIKERQVHHTGQLLEAFRQHSAYPSLVKLAVWEPPLEDKSGLESELVAIIANLMDEYLEQRLQTLLIKERQRELSREERYEYMTLLKELKPNSTAKD